MTYRSNSFVVDAFEFTRKYDDRTAPKWFDKAVNDEKVFLNSSIVDGASHIYGFTIYSERGRIKGKCGDFVIRAETGEISVLSGKLFRKLFRPNK